MITIGIPKITKKNKRARLSCEIEMNNEIKVPKEIADKAIVPIQRMLEVKPS